MASISTPVTVICPSGVLNAENVFSLEQQLVSIGRDKSVDELVVDMSYVDSLDNAGLVSLISALNGAQARFNRLSLCSVPPSVRIVFELTQLDRLFQMIDREPAAMAA
ncbi:MAG: STAS domain-containing protein [Cyanobacteria bacterium J06598_1]